jgi:hypothetical protein
MPKYMLEDTGEDVKATKLPSDPTEWESFFTDLSKIIVKLVEVVFWILIGFLIGYISRGL